MKQNCHPIERPSCDRGFPLVGAVDRRNPGPW